MTEKKNEWKMLLVGFVVVLLMMAISPRGFAQGPVEQQVYVLCAATLSYKMTMEGKTGKGPRYRMYEKATAAYYIRISNQYRPAVLQVVAQIHSGQLKMSDVNGTATNCLRWHKNDEIDDI